MNDLPIHFLFVACALVFNILPSLFDPFLLSTNYFLFVFFQTFSLVFFLFRKIIFSTFAHFNILTFRHFDIRSGGGPRFITLWLWKVVVRHDERRLHAALRGLRPNRTIHQPFRIRICIFQIDMCIRFAANNDAIRLQDLLKNIWKKVFFKNI